jgi:alpha-tubulin suppressor-like RCC1 family protein
VGPVHTFSAEAFDSTGTPRYAGEVTGITRADDRVTVVSLSLQEVNPPPPSSNEAPVLTSLVAGPGSVAPGGTLPLVATAQDANPGDSLTYAWTASAGTFSSTSSGSTTWTAPADTDRATLTLTVTDSQGASLTVSLTVPVNASAGSRTAGFTLNHWPQVKALSSWPSPLAGGETATAEALAVDEEGDPLSYQWDAGCAGTWTNRTSATAQFTPTVRPEGSTCLPCPLTVIVADGRGGQSPRTLPLCIQPPPPAPVIVETFQSAPSTRGGAPITLRARAEDPKGSALSFSWESTTGTLGTPVTGTHGSELVWAPPSTCARADLLPAAITLTVTNAEGLSTPVTFTVKGVPPCTPFWKSLSVRRNRSLAVDADGLVWEWGEASPTDVTSTERRTPVARKDLHEVVAAALGDFHTLAVKSDGTVWAWGHGGLGRLGDGMTLDRTSPVQVLELTEVGAVAAGQHHSLALKKDGTVWAWGSNAAGVLGEGTSVLQRLMPVQVAGLSGVVAIAAGTGFSLALKSDGTVWAWGDNKFNQLGLGNTVLERRTPVRVDSLSGAVVALATGNNHTLALKSDGTVWAWGQGSAGQLGDGTPLYSKLPVQVAHLSAVVAVAAGNSHSLAVKSDGTVWAWGDNHRGQLGEGTNTQHTTPVRVADVGGAVAVAAGSWTSLAVKLDGTLQAWGDNLYGQLGNGKPIGRAAPAQVAGLSGVRTLTVEARNALAVKSDGTVWAWGDNSFGQLGDGTTTTRASPVQVAGLGGVVATGLGEMFSLALKSDGTVWTWGFRLQNTGPTPSGTTPVQVTDFGGVMAISAGRRHALALKKDGTVWAWGNNEHGVLGDGTTTFRATPVQVQGLTEVTAIASGGDHGLALKRDGTVWAWGNNNAGQLGDGTTTLRTTLVQVEGLSSVVAISTGLDCSLALKSDGTVWAWGDNAFGQLGDGTTTRRTTPVPVTALTGVVAIPQGGSMLAVTSDGTFWRWGGTRPGGSPTDYRTTPERVTSLPGTRALALLADHTLVLNLDGTVWTWGRSEHGQLGDGIRAFELTPTPAVLSAYTDG